jgi:L-fucose mutarotase
MERQGFLKRSTKAFAIVQSGETRKYGNVSLKKGVIPVEHGG